MQPISEKREAQFRGPSSSEDFNKWMDDNYYDLIQLFNFATEYGIEIPRNMEMLVVENITLQKKLNSLQSLIDNITKALTSENKVLYKSFASSVTFADSTDGINLEHDTDFGLLKIPHVQEISKIYLVDLNKQNFIPKTFQAKVYESVEPIDIKEATIDLPDVASNDSNLLDMFDGDKSSFWLRKTIKDSSVSDVYFCIELDLPINIINHTRANILTIDPTPLSSITLLDIYYRTVNDWQRLPSYPTKEIGGQIQPVEINDLGRMKFCFPTRDVVGVRIYCKQSNWFLENEMRNFYYGFRNIDVNYMAFRTETSKIRVAFDIPDQEKMFTSILSVKPIFSDGSIVGSDLFSVYKIHYNLAGQDTEAKLGEQLPAGVQRVYVEIGLMLSSQVSPLLSGLVMEYEST
ncbi:MAG TPA: hypothetical protein VIL29_04955 [Pseudothermotoga sp.]